MAKRNVTISLDSKVYEQFREHCEMNGLVLSKKIEMWMINCLADSKEKEAKNKKGKNE